MHLSFILSKYISTLFLRWFFLVTVIILIIVALFDFSELLRRASTLQGTTFHILFKMLIFKMPSLIQHILPFIVLFSSILTLWKLNRHHELEVLKASGLSVWELILPMMGTSLLIGMLDLMIFNPLSSQMRLQYEHLEDRYFKGYQGSLAITEGGLWLREGLKTSHRIYRINRIDPFTKVLHKVSIFQLDLEDQFLNRIEATEGYFKDTFLELKSAWVSGPDELPKYHPHFSLSTNLTLSSLQDTGADPLSISFWDLPRYSFLLEKSGLSSLKYRLAWHSLLARWIGLSVMVFLAACCSLRPLRQGGTLFIISAGVTTAFILYFLRDISYALGSSLAIPVFLAAWSPLLIAGLIGLICLLHFEDG